MIDKTGMIPAVIERMLKLQVGEALDLRTYKRNRSVRIFKTADDAFTVIEDGFQYSECTVDLKGFRKLMKTLLKREFPRSTKIRVYWLDRTQADEIRTKRSYNTGMKLLTITLALSTALMLTPVSFAHAEPKQCTAAEDFTLKAEPIEYAPGTDPVPTREKSFRKLPIALNEESIRSRIRLTDDSRLDTVQSFVRTTDVGPMGMFRIVGLFNTVAPIEEQVQSRRAAETAITFITEQKNLFGPIDRQELGERMTRFAGDKYVVFLERRIRGALLSVFYAETTIQGALSRVDYVVMPITEPMMKALSTGRFIPFKKAQEIAFADMGCILPEEIPEFLRPSLELVASARKPYALWRVTISVKDGAGILYEMDAFTGDILLRTSAKNQKIYY